MSLQLNQIKKMAGPHKGMKNLLKMYWAYRSDLTTIVNSGSKHTINPHARMHRSEILVQLTQGDKERIEKELEKVKEFISDLEQLLKIK